MACRPPGTRPHRSTALAPPQPHADGGSKHTQDAAHLNPLPTLSAATNSTATSIGTDLSAVPCRMSTGGSRRPTAGPSFLRRRQPAVGARPGVGSGQPPAGSHPAGGARPP